MEQNNWSIRAFRGVQAGASRLALGIALIAAIYHLQLVVTGIPEAYEFRTTHVMLLLPLAFLLKPSASEQRPWLVVWDLLMIVISLATTSYLSLFSYDQIIERLPGVDELSGLQLVLGSALVFCVLEGARRIVGLGMVVICVLAILYTLLGGFVPGAFNYTGSSYVDLVDKLVFTTEGLFSSPIAASATFIFIFVLFGKFLERSGAGELFIDIAFALAGKSRGGPAKVAVISSAFMGSISGSATANVVSTGVYTIPLMKQGGIYTCSCGGSRSFRLNRRANSAACNGSRSVPARRLSRCPLYRTDCYCGYSCIDVFCCNICSGAF